MGFALVIGFCSVLSAFIPFLFPLTALQLTQSLHLVHVDIPEFGDIRDAVKLNCSYSMGRNELNSVKWYKDHQEFFR
jgi:hypothetical protein